MSSLGQNCPRDRSSFMTDNSELAFTKYGWSVCLWIITASFQVVILCCISPTTAQRSLSSKYGYHIAALNQIQAVLTCKAVDRDNPSHSGLSTCIPMSDATFSFVTSVFTIGGLVGSAVANLVMEKWGRRGAIRMSALFSVLGAGLMAISDTFTPFAFGRYGLSVFTTQLVMLIRLCIQAPRRNRCRFRTLHRSGVHRRDFAFKNKRESR
jgi:uncharacterized membrane protein YeaQ/YmgE (transglycosylase-associated protein family)